MMKLSQQLTSMLTHMLVDGLQEPHLRWGEEDLPWETDPGGLPAVRVAVGTCSPGFDIWQGIRSPATVGLYPMSLHQLWEYYVRASAPAFPTYRQSSSTARRPRPSALADINTVALASVMLPVSQKLMEEYAVRIEERRLGPVPRYSRAWRWLSDALEQALWRTALELGSATAIAIPMHNPLLAKSRQEVLPKHHQGDYHGIDKLDNWPQKSIAVMCGLGQFGVSRLVMRDEVTPAGVRRQMGQLRSLVVYDGEMGSAAGDVDLEDQVRRQLVSQVVDFRQGYGERGHLRFCSYSHPQQDHACRACLTYCPSGSLPRSSPRRDGGYPSGVQGDSGRYFDEWLQFEYATCRQEMYAFRDYLYPDWTCARCMPICARRGKTDSAAATAYWDLWNEA